MATIIEQTNFFLTKEEAKKLKKLYTQFYNMPIFTTVEKGEDDSEKKALFKRYADYMVELANNFNLPLEKDGAQLKIGKDNEFVYAIVN